eukprot:9500250-Pyramimonas_sp.AAC.1
MLDTATSGVKPENHDMNYGMFHTAVRTAMLTRRDNSPARRTPQHARAMSSVETAPFCDASGAALRPH